MASSEFCQDKEVKVPLSSIQNQQTEHRTEVSSLQKPKAVRDGQYSDPVYKKLSLINGEINKLTKDQLQAKCAELRLDTRGMKDILKKRIKNYYKRKKLMKARVHPPEGSKTPYDYLLVIDFEATCEEDVENYNHEIIEFPAILVDVQQNKIVDEFHSYCRPLLNPQLSKFCCNLTGITQSQVDTADSFPLVLKSMEKWMESQCLGSERSFAVATDGPWDMSRFLNGQCSLSDITFPQWARRWVNVRKTYANFYQCRRTKITNMLENLGLTFEGNLHCGRDDARNIAQICIRMMEDGCVIRPNEELRCWTPGELRAYSSDVTTATLTHSNICEENKSKKKSPRKSASVDVVSAFSCLAITTQADHNDSDQEDVEDLLQYYRLQKS
ncbi:3'-5' exoribonuclease 1-like isoform X2 [Liolophura sinensis]|uniref:3'-5' exoribonuclease 1-like isoform X2 n=1 Tax=Liolophura sinensis TaxID=3198878 RepID=UPI00315967FD